MARSEIAIWSTVGKKLLLAVTGLGLFVFIVGHLLGNLLLLVGPEPFNAYSHTLISLGEILYVVEALLLLAFVVHFVMGITIYLGNRKARDNRYQISRAQGEPSRMTFSSRNMIWTGLVILVFTVLHLINFKYGPGIDEGYVTFINGEPVRDLYRLVVEFFQNPINVIWYVGAMILLGFHLRHGFWSAIQSLGGYHPRLTPVIYGFGVAAAIVLGFGFLFIPLWIYLGGAA